MEIFKIIYSLGVLIIIVGNILNIFSGTWLHDVDRIMFGVSTIGAFIGGLFFFPTFLDETQKEPPTYSSPIK